jgi:acylphosphatase
MRAATRLVIRGLVQGVGFRWWAVRRARALGLDGWVRNLSGGAVEIYAAGPPAALDRLEDACRRGPVSARVVTVGRAVADDDGTCGFEARATL